MNCIIPCWGSTSSRKKLPSDKIWGGDKVWISPCWKTHGCPRSWALHWPPRNSANNWAVRKQVCNLKAFNQVTGPLHRNVPRNSINNAQIDSGDHSDKTTIIKTVWSLLSPLNLGFKIINLFAGDSKIGEERGRQDLWQMLGLVLYFYRT